MAVSAIRGTQRNHPVVPHKVQAKKNVATQVASQIVEQLSQAVSTKLKLSKASVSHISEIVQAAKALDLQRVIKAFHAAENMERFASQAHTELAFDKKAKNAIETLKTGYLVAIIQQACIQREFRVLLNPLAKNWRIESLSTEHILETLYDLDSSFSRRLAHEIEAISSIDFNRHKLDPLQMLKICLFSEKELERAKDKTELVYIRAQESLMPRCLVIDPNRVAFTILSKKHGALKAEGAFKRVTDAIDVTPLEKGLKARRVVRLISKAYEEISSKELAFEELYGKILNWMHYASKRRTKETKTQILDEAFDHDLYIFTAYTPEEQRKKLPFPELLQVLQDVGRTLSKMHQDGVVHHDFKTKNVLYRKLPSGKVEAKIIDFGHCYKPRESSTYLKKRKKGYGTLRYTSVDALENPRLKDDVRALAKAEDMYALGSLIYELYFQKPTPWGSEVYKALKATENRERHRKKAIRLQRETAHELADLSNRTNGDIETEFIWIISRLLEPNPQSRMKIGEFTNALKKVNALTLSDQDT